MVPRREFILGETKYIDLRVTSSVPQAVIVTSASWRLVRDESEILSGVCTIDGDIVSACIEPPERGMYMYETTYVVGAETRIFRAQILVV